MVDACCAVRPSSDWNAAFGMRRRWMMDAFEQLVSEILWMEGYWVRTSVKVELTPAEKKAIGLPSCPRWELDVVAYSGCDNLLKVIECKSYLDSRGVVLCAVDGTNEKSAKHYKLFCNEPLRKTVFERLRRQFADSGACRPDAEVKLCLACGRIATDTDRKGLHEHFAEKGWELWDESWLRERLKKMSARGYENQVSAVVAKLLIPLVAKELNVGSGTVQRPELRASAKRVVG
jgi:hypothetical protein